MCYFHIERYLPFKERPPWGVGREETRYPCTGMQRTFVQLHGAVLGGSTSPQKASSKKYCTYIYFHTNIRPRPATRAACCSHP